MTKAGVLLEKGVKPTWWNGADGKSVLPLRKTRPQRYREWVFMTIPCLAEVLIPWECSAGGELGEEDILGEVLSAASFPSFFIHPIILRKKQCKKRCFSF